jgi:hypothetical protein
MTTRTKSLIAGTAIAGLGVVAAAQAAPPSAHQLSIAAKPTRVIYGGKVAITGQLTGADNAGEDITLDEDPYPFGAFNKLATTVTNSTGAYSFSVTPTVNTKYRASAKSKSPATSPVVLVKVAPRITIKVTDKTPAQGQKVTFSGTVTPAHDGQPILLQRQSGETWKTVATGTLVDAGTELSKYSFTRKITRDGKFRVLKRRDDDHAYGKSQKRFLDVQS